MLFRSYMDGNSNSASGESVHVGGVDTDDFALGVEDRTAAATVGGGGIVDELVGREFREPSKVRSNPFRTSFKPFLVRPLTKLGRYCMVPSELRGMAFGFPS